MADTGVVLSAFGFFLIVGTLLGISGLVADGIEVPTAPSEQDSEEGNDQSFTGAVVECVLTLFGDCSRQTKTRVFQAITDLVTFALSATVFLFQLLTFQVPEIPAWLNALVVLPPASALAYVGLKFVRGIG